MITASGDGTPRDAGHPALRWDGLLVAGASLRAGLLIASSSCSRRRWCPMPPAVWPGLGPQCGFGAPRGGAAGRTAAAAAGIGLGADGAGVVPGFVFLLA